MNSLIFALSPWSTSTLIRLNICWSQRSVLISCKKNNISIMKGVTIYSIIDKTTARKSTFKRMLKLVWIIYADNLCKDWAHKTPKHMSAATLRGCKKSVLSWGIQSIISSDKCFASVTPIGTWLRVMFMCRLPEDQTLIFLF